MAPIAGYQRWDQALFLHWPAPLRAAVFRRVGAARRARAAVSARPDRAPLRRRRDELSLARRQGALLLRVDAYGPAGRGRGRFARALPRRTLRALLALARGGAAA